MPFFFFIWSDERIAHLAANGVTPEEFEQVVCNPDERGISRSTGYPTAFGPTDEGKYLVCVFQLIDADTVAPITAFEPEDA
jgi:hypothetical protein